MNMSHILLPPGKYGRWLIFLLPTRHNFIIQHTFLNETIIIVIHNQFCLHACMQSTFAPDIRDAPDVTLLVTVE